MPGTFLVAATGLNLREQPDLNAAILVALKRGMYVVRLDDVVWGDGWWRVRAETRDMAYEGYVSAKFLRQPGSDGGTGLEVSREKLARLAPNGRREILDALPAAFAEHFPVYQVNTPSRIAHFLAQCAHESGGFRYAQELGGAAYFKRLYEDNRRLAEKLGNTQPGDGARYHGRGIIQLTGRYNYRVFGAALGLDLESTPDLAAQPEIGARIALEYWKQKGLNALADADDIVEITRRINGGQNGLADRREYLATAKRIWPALVSA
jgi:putative chitinase